MPRLNIDQMIELLEGLHTQVSICYDLSRNDDLTEELERIKDKLEQIIHTLINFIS